MSSALPPSGAEALLLKIGCCSAICVSHCLKPQASASSKHHKLAAAE
jgi:hypothetical protein